MAIEKMYLESIKTIYTELFTINFLNTGYGPPNKTFISDSIYTQPDADTKDLFTNHGMGYRFFGNTLLCFIRTESLPLLSPPAIEPKVPFTKFSGNVQIRFLLNASTDFITKTNVAAAGAKEIYQFTNQVNAGTGGFICMHTEGVNNDDLKNVDTVKADKTCFGAIDVHNNGATDASYDLFVAGPENQLRSPVYSIRFKSKI